MPQPSNLRLVSEAALTVALGNLPQGQHNADPNIGEWVTSPFIRANRNGTLGAGTSYPMFIPVTNSWTVSQCAINVTTAVAAATATVTLYPDDGTRRAATATPLASSPTIDCSTTGVKTATFATPPVTSFPGVWCNIAFSATTVGIAWAEVFGMGTSLSTTVGDMFTVTPLSAPENAALATAFWVPRVGLLRSA